MVAIIIFDQRLNAHSKTYNATAKVLKMTVMMVVVVVKIMMIMPVLAVMVKVERSGANIRFIIVCGFGPAFFIKKRYFKATHLLGK